MSPSRLRGIGRGGLIPLCAGEGDYQQHAALARANRLPQEAMGAFPGGEIWPATLRAGRIAFYRSLGTLAAFGLGWGKRVEQVRQKARRDVASLGHGSGEKGRGPQ
jgi:hypothetical protein